VRAHFLNSSSERPVLSEAPLELVEHALVEIGRDGLDRHALQHLGAPERRRRHRDAQRQLGAAQADFLEIDRALRPRVAGAAEFARLVPRPPGVLFLNLGEVAVEIVADDAIH